MNKQAKQPKPRIKELEDELTGNITDQQATTETGKRDVKSDSYSKTQERKYRTFNIRQGNRRRHPTRVLNQYYAVNKDTENAQSIFEKALIHEDEGSKLDKVYKPKAHDMIADQMGIVTTALDNYVKSKKRFVRSMPVGV